MRKVELTKTVGTCGSDIFKKMLEGGDLQADKIANLVDSVVVINGYAKCHIITDDNEFDVNYFATDDGFFQTGSNWFLESVERYYESVNKFKISKIKTSKGSTYKAVPVLASEAE